MSGLFESQDEQAEYLRLQKASEEGLELETGIAEERAARAEELKGVQDRHDQRDRQIQAQFKADEYKESLLPWEVETVVDRWRGGFLRYATAYNTLGLMSDETAAGFMDAKSEYENGLTMGMDQADLSGFRKELNNVLGTVSQTISQATAGGLRFLPIVGQAAGLSAYASWGLSSAAETHRELTDKGFSDEAAWNQGLLEGGIEQATMLLFSGLGKTKFLRGLGGVEGMWAKKTGVPLTASRVAKLAKPSKFFKDTFSRATREKGKHALMGVAGELVEETATEMMVNLNRAGQFPIYGYGTGIEGYEDVANWHNDGYSDYRSFTESPMVNTLQDVMWYTFTTMGLIHFPGVAKEAMADFGENPSRKNAKAVREILPLLGIDQDLDTLEGRDAAALLWNKLREDGMTDGQLAEIAEANGVRFAVNPDLEYVKEGDMPSSLTGAYEVQPGVVLDKILTSEEAATAENLERALVDLHERTGAKENLKLRFFDGGPATIDGLTQRNEDGTGTIWISRNGLRNYGAGLADSFELRDFLNGVYAHELHDAIVRTDIATGTGHASALDRAIKDFDPEGYEAHKEAYAKKYKEVHGKDQPEAEADREAISTYLQRIIERGESGLLHFLAGEDLGLFSRMRQWSHKRRNALGKESFHDLLFGMLNSVGNARGIEPELVPLGPGSGAEAASKILGDVIDSKPPASDEETGEAPRERVRKPKPGLTRHVQRLLNKHKGETGAESQARLEPLLGEEVYIFVEETGVIEKGVLENLVDEELDQAIVDGALVPKKHILGRVARISAATEGDAETTVSKMSEDQRQLEAATLEVDPNNLAQAVHEEEMDTRVDESTDESASEATDEAAEDPEAAAIEEQLEQQAEQVASQERVADAAAELVDQVEDGRNPPPVDRGAARELAPSAVREPGGGLTDAVTVDMLPDPNLDPEIGLVSDPDEIMTAHSEAAQRLSGELLESRRGIAETMDQEAREEYAAELNQQASDEGWAPSRPITSDLQDLALAQYLQDKGIFNAENMNAGREVLASRTLNPEYKALLQNMNSLQLDFEILLRVRNDERQHTALAGDSQDKRVALMEEAAKRAVMHADGRRRLQTEDNEVEIADGTLSRKDSFSEQQALERQLAADERLVDAGYNADQRMNLSNNLAAMEFLLERGIPAKYVSVSPEGVVTLDEKVKYVKEERKVKPEEAEARMVLEAATMMSLVDDILAGVVVVEPEDVPSATQIKDASEATTETALDKLDESQQQEYFELIAGEAENGLGGTTKEGKPKTKEIWLAEMHKKYPGTEDIDVDNPEFSSAIEDAVARGLLGFRADKAKPGRYETQRDAYIGEKIRWALKTFNQKNEQRKRRDKEGATTREGRQDRARQLMDEENLEPLTDAEAEEVHKVVVEEADRGRTRDQQREALTGESRRPPPPKKKGIWVVAGITSLLEEIADEAGVSRYTDILDLREANKSGNLYWTAETLEEHADEIQAALRAALLLNEDTALDSRISGAIDGIHEQFEEPASGWSEGKFPMTGDQVAHRQEVDRSVKEVETEVYNLRNADTEHPSVPANRPPVLTRRDIAPNKFFTVIDGDQTEIVFFNESQYDWDSELPVEAIDGRTYTVVEDDATGEWWLEPSHEARDFFITELQDAPENQFPLDEHGRARGEDFKGIRRRDAGDSLADVAEAKEKARARATRKPSPLAEQMAQSRDRKAAKLTKELAEIKEWLKKNAPDATYRDQTSVPDEHVEEAKIKFSRLAEVSRQINLMNEDSDGSKAAESESLRTDIDQKIKTVVNFVVDIIDKTPWGKRREARKAGETAEEIRSLVEQLVPDDAERQADLLAVVKLEMLQRANTDGWRRASRAFLGKLRGAVAKAKKKLAPLVADRAELDGKLKEAFDINEKVAADFEMMQQALAGVKVEDLKGEDKKDFNKAISGLKEMAKKTSVLHASLLKMYKANEKRISDALGKDFVLGLLSKDTKHLVDPDLLSKLSDAEHIMGTGWAETAAALEAAGEKVEPPKRTASEQEWDEWWGEAKKMPGLVKALDRHFAAFEHKIKNLGMKRKTVDPMEGPPPHGEFIPVSQAVGGPRTYAAVAVGLQVGVSHNERAKTGFPLDPKLEAGLHDAVIERLSHEFGERGEGFADLSEIEAAMQVAWKLAETLSGPNETNEQLGEKLISLSKQITMVQEGRELRKMRQHAPAELATLVDWLWAEPKGMTPAGQQIFTNVWDESYVGATADFMPTEFGTIKMGLITGEWPKHWKRVVNERSKRYSVRKLDGTESFSLRTDDGKLSTQALINRYYDISVEDVPLDYYAAAEEREAEVPPASEQKKRKRIRVRIKETGAGPGTGFIDVLKGAERVEKRGPRGELYTEEKPYEIDVDVEEGADIRALLYHVVSQLSNGAYRMAVKEGLVPEGMEEVYARRAAGQTWTDFADRVLLDDGKSQPIEDLYDDKGNFLPGPEWTYANREVYEERKAATRREKNPDGSDNPIQAAAKREVAAAAKRAEKRGEVLDVPATLKNALARMYKKVDKELARFMLRNPEGAVLYKKDEVKLSARTIAGDLAGILLENPHLHGYDSAYSVGILDGLEVMGLLRVWPEFSEDSGAALESWLQFIGILSAQSVGSATRTELQDGLENDNAIRDTMIVYSLLREATTPSQRTKIIRDNVGTLVRTKKLDINGKWTGEYEESLEPNGHTNNLIMLFGDQRDPEVRKRLGIENVVDGEGNPIRVDPGYLMVRKLFAAGSVVDAQAHNRISQIAQNWGGRIPADMTRDQFLELFKQDAPLVSGNDLALLMQDDFTDGAENAKKVGDIYAGMFSLAFGNISLYGDPDNAFHALGFMTQEGMLKDLNPMGLTHTLPVRITKEKAGEQRGRATDQDKRGWATRAVSWLTGEELDSTTDGLKAEGIYGPAGFHEAAVREAVHILNSNGAFNVSYAQAVAALRGKWEMELYQMGADTGRKSPHVRLNNTAGKFIGAVKEYLETPEGVERLGEASEGASNHASNFDRKYSPNTPQGRKNRKKRIKTEKSDSQLGAESASLRTVADEGGRRGRRSTPAARSRGVEREYEAARAQAIQEREEDDARKKSDREVRKLAESKIKRLGPLNIIKEAADVARRGLRAGFNDVDQVALTLAINGMAAADKKKHVEAISLAIAASISISSEFARGLRASGTVLTEEGQRLRSMNNAVFAPERKVKHQIERLRAEGKPMEAERVHKDWINGRGQFAGKGLPALHKYLRTMGIDPFALSGMKNDPYYANKVLNLSQQHKATFMDGASEFFRNSILGALTTQAANIVGTLPYFAWEVGVKRNLEALVNLAVQDPNLPTFAENAVIFKHMLKNQSIGAAMGLKAFKEESPTVEAMLGYEGRGGGHTKVEGLRTAIKGKKGKAIRIPQNVLLGFDEYMKWTIANGFAAGYAFRAARAAVKNGSIHPDESAQFMDKLLDPKVRDKAIYTPAMNEALRILWQTPLDKPGQKLIQLRDTFTPLRFVMPFIVTPVNIFKTGVRMSPLGSASLIVKMAQARREGKSVSETWGKLSPDAIEQGVSWMMLFALLGLKNPEEPEEEWITGSSQEYEAGPRQSAMREGMPPPFSVKVGGTWVSYERIEPFATVVATLVDVAEGLQTGDPTKLGDKTAKSLYGQMYNKTFTRSFADMIDAAHNWRERGFLSGAGHWATNFATAWIPNYIRSTGRALQTKMPERGIWGDDEEMKDRTYDRLRAKTEVGLVDDTPKVDIWGREIDRTNLHGPTSSFLYQLLVPARLKSTDLFAGDRALLNWNAKHAETDKAKYPEPPDKFMSFRGEKRHFNDKQYNEYGRMAGNIARQLVSTSNLNVDNPTESDIAIIGDSLSRARSMARRILGPKFFGKGLERSEFEVVEVAEEIRNAQIKSWANKLSEKKPTWKNLNSDQKKLPKEKKADILGELQRQQEEEKDAALEKLTQLGIDVPTALQKFGGGRTGRRRVAAAMHGRT